MNIGNACMAEKRGLIIPLVPSLCWNYTPSHFYCSFRCLVQSLRRIEQPAYINKYLTQENCNLKKYQQKCDILQNILQTQIITPKPKNNNMVWIFSRVLVPWMNVPNTIRELFSVYLCREICGLLCERIAVLHVSHI